MRRKASRSKPSPAVLCRLSIRPANVTNAPAEHIVTFLINYQDPKTGRNKYIDRLVSQQLLLCHDGTAVAYLLLLSHLKVA
jgi:hypothetical protein